MRSTWNVSRGTLRDVGHERRDGAARPRAWGVAEVAGSGEAAAEPERAPRSTARNGVLADLLEGDVGTRLEMDILGTRHPVTVIPESPYDPENARLRS